MNVGISVADLRVVLTMIFGSLSLNLVATGWVNFMGIFVDWLSAGIYDVSIKWRMRFGWCRWLRSRDSIGIL